MKKKHTPSPWTYIAPHIHNTLQVTSRDPQIRIGNELLTLNDKISEADGMLIAAAPELLEAVEGFFEIFQQDHPNSRYSLKKQIANLIKKAKGET